ncbi:FlgB family protein [Dinoroseobacter sp. S375]|uniref:FlgB family protein n=1 Tax=Dinoroseobacter sp. S375 TaxID=3415136 RepID=UPI003C7A5410
MKNLTILNTASAMAAHATERHGAIARNIAHADTPGYRSQDLRSFAESFREISSSGMRTTRDGHAFGVHRDLDLTLYDITDTPIAPNGNSVSLEHEMVRMAENRHQHELALSVYRSSMNILRTSLGRG